MSKAKFSSKAKEAILISKEQADIASTELPEQPRERRPEFLTVNDTRPRTYTAIGVAVGTLVGGLISWFAHRSSSPGVSLGLAFGAIIGAFFDGVIRRKFVVLVVAGGAVLALGIWVAMREF